MKEFFRNKYVIFVLQAFAVACGTFIMGFAFRSFFIPTQITPSGFSGLSTIISDLLAKINIALSPSIIYIIINIACFVLAILLFGVRFATLTTIGILSYSLFMEVLYLPTIPTDDLLLISIIGGALMGTGLGIVFRFGGSTGGSDVVAMTINKKFPKIKTGQCTFLINLVVIALSMIVYGLDKTLYAFIAIFLSGKVTDIILSGTKTVKAIYIICTKDEEISKKLITAFGQGVTKIEATGMFSHQNKKLLLCLVSTHQSPFVKHIVAQIEPTAIVFSTSVTEALGEKAFLKIKEKEKVKKVKATTKSKLFYKRKELKEVKDMKTLKKKVFHMKNSSKKTSEIDFDTFLSNEDTYPITIKEENKTEK